jgi:hypothetical protein
MENIMPDAAPKTRLLSEQRQKTNEARRKVMLAAATALVATLPAKDMVGLIWNTTGTKTCLAHSGMVEHLKTYTHCL